MGHAKNQMIKYEEQGYSEDIDKYVCYNCVGNEYLITFIKDNADHNTCDYCEEEVEDNISIHLSDLLKIMAEGIHTEWEDPNESVGWDGREGGWLGVNVIDTYDLIYDELSEEHQIENQVLLGDIIDSFSDQGWCERDPYRGRKYDEDFFTWELFCNQIKYETRYVFFRSEENSNLYGDIYNQPYEILETIGGSLEELELVRSKNIPRRFYRGRTHDISEQINSVKQLGPPDRSIAINPNRMSPAGIPMFYGALDEQTVLDEIQDGKPIFTVGIFDLLHDLNLIDLTKIPTLPSLFDEERRPLRNIIIFMNKFVKDLSKSVEKGKAEHIEYIPTQVVTEYLRRVYRTEGGEQVHGILYPSSKNTEGVCCVLFIDNESCTQDRTDPSKVLSLDSSTIHTMKL